jgi:type II secretory pathway component PulL
MTMSEYEERFRPLAPSLHQTFAEVRRPSRGGRRSRRLSVMAALFGVMTITSKAALHHSSHPDDSQEGNPVLVW